MLDATPTRRLVTIALLGVMSTVALWLVARSPGVRPEGGFATGSPEHSMALADRDVARHLPAARLDELDSGGTSGVGAGDEERRALETDAALAAAAAGAGDLRAALRVVDRATGEPVEGAEVTRVWFEGERLRSGWSSAPSDEDGALDLTWGGAPAVDVRLEADGFVRGTVPALDPLVTPPGVDRGPGSIERVEVGLERSASIVVVPIGFAAGASGLALLFEDGDARDKRADQRLEWDGEGPITFENVQARRASVVLCVRNEPIVSKQSIATAPGAEVRVELEARRGEELRGRVVEKSTRQPLEGVTIRAAPELSGVSSAVERLPFEAVVTGPDGSFLIRGLPPGRVVLRLTPPVGPSVDREVVVIEGESTRTRELAVSGAATVSGRVIVPDGTPDGAAVRVVVVATSEASGLPAQDLSTRVVETLSDRGVLATVRPDRTFHCDAAPSGRSVTVAAYVEGALGVTTVSTPLKFGEERSGVEVTVLRQEPLSFRVVDPQGAPVEAVRASIRRSFGKSAFWTPWKDLVSERGRFDVRSDPASVRRIRLRADGFLAFEAEWPSVEGRPAVEPEFTLTPTLELRVLVRDTSGLAVRGARVFATPAEVARAGNARAARTVRRSARADGFGRATVALDDEGTWSVVVAASGYETAEPVEERVGVEAPTARLEFVLEETIPPEPATIEGRFVRKGDGAPLPALHFDGLGAGSAEIDGADFRLVGLRPGRVRLVAHADGYESVRLPVDQLRPGETLDVGEIATRGATRLDVRVRDENGQSIRDARVRLVRLPAKKGGRDDLPPRLDFPRRADGRGVYRIGGVARVKWRLLVDRDRYRRLVRTVKITGPRQTIDVVLERR